MKKRFISIAKKAMVWTMAASMLVATPLTASAQGLSDVYKIEDQWGNSLGPDFKPGESGDPTRTGTVTNTNSTPLDLETAGQIGYIAIEQQDIEENYEPDPVTGKQEHKLSVAVYDTADKQMTMTAELAQKFSWKSSNTSVATFATMEGNKTGATNEMMLQIKGGGRAEITVSLNDYKNDIFFSDTINVYITQHATYIGFNEKWLKDDAVAGASLTLDDYLEVEPAGATDEITYTIVSNTAKKATLKNGVLKLNAKSKSTDDPVKIVAIGADVRSKVTEIKIADLIPAKDASFTLNKTTPVAKNKNYEWWVNDVTEKVDCAVTLKAASGESNDRVVSWTSNKTDIVDIKTLPRTEDNPKGKQVELTAKSVGTAQITAKTSTGKSFKFKAVVKADLTDIELEEVGTAYSGQTVQLQATQVFAEKSDSTKRHENFTDAGLTWEFVDKAAAKKVASINAKTGALTIKPTVGEKASVDVRAVNSKATREKGKKALGADKNIHIDLQQVSIKEIIVYPNAAVNYETDKNGFVRSFLNGSKPKNNTAKTSVAVGNRKTYGLYAVGEVDGQEYKGNAAFVLGWSVNNPKLATVKKSNAEGTKTASITGVKKGSATVTVNSVVQVGTTYKPIKVTLKTTVAQPSKTIKLTTKNTAISNKKQTVTFKATLEKGSSTKAADIEWTVAKVGDSTSTTKFDKGKLKYVVGYKLTNGTVAAGDTLLIRARIKDTGVSASMRMKVVEPSTKVELKINQGQNDVPIVKNKVTLKAGFNYTIPGDTTSKTDYEDYVITPMVNEKAPDPEKGVAAVTYTVNKQDYVRIVYNKDGSAVIKPVQDGTVKLTPVTADGKKGKAITITVTGTDLIDTPNAPYTVE